VVPYLIPIFLPIALAFFLVQRRYLTTSRELKRFEAVTRSPLYSSFSAALKGLPTIRAFSAADRFRAVFLDALARNGAWFFSFLTCARWIGFRLDLMASIIIMAAPLAMVALRDSVSARLAGLALTQSLQLSGILQWMVRQAAEAENHMTSVERMMHYGDLDQEPPTVARGGGAPPDGWPPSGEIKYEGVWAVYRPGLPAVLRDVTFTIEVGFGCVGWGVGGLGSPFLSALSYRLYHYCRKHR
jgi:ABC-type multidrug transport system fused ATPase/permease subunit